MKTRARKILVALSGLVSLGIIGLLDYFTGREISFGVFYFLPIWLTTWYFNFRAGIFISFLGALVWFVVDDASGNTYSSPFIPCWNAVARLAYFLTFAFLLSNIRERLEISEGKVKRLSRLLPICSSCKKIRSAQGEWCEIEQYISSHSETDFSHGICPDCTKRLYPEHADELLKKWGAK